MMALETRISTSKPMGQNGHNVRFTSISVVNTSETSDFEKQSKPNSSLHNFYKFPTSPLVKNSHVNKVTLSQNNRGSSDNNATLHPYNSSPQITRIERLIPPHVNGTNKRPSQNGRITLGAQRESSLNSLDNSDSGNERLSSTQALKRRNSKITGSLLNRPAARNQTRPTDKRYSLQQPNLTLQSRLSKSSSLPDGKIITQLHARKMSNEDGDSSRGTPTNRRFKKQQKSSQKRIMLYQKFKLYARMSLFCIRQSNAHMLRNKAYDEIAPYLNSLSFYEFGGAVEEVDLMFDISKFKADKQLRISEETKRVLTSPPIERTEKDLRYAQVALRNIRSFAEYPTRMQRKIVEVGRYEKFESKRVIVRQGHPASAFYFILSGSVVVMVYEGDTKVAKPVAYMKKGQTFGELAIIHRTTRQSTVIAKETIELLSIDIEDFHNIFMAGGVKNITDPDHNDFLRSLTLLRTWPLEKMIENPDKCVFHYFKRGDVLVKDSNYSDWIFIVKSGSVQVLKKLKRVEAQDSKKKTETKTEFKSEKTKREERALLEKQRRYILPDIHIPLSTPTEITEDTTLQLPAINLIPVANERQKTNDSISNRLRNITSKSPSPRTKRKQNMSNPSQTKHLPPIHRSGSFQTSKGMSWITMPREHTLLQDKKLINGQLNNITTLSLSQIDLQNCENQYESSKANINSVTNSSQDGSTVPYISVNDESMLSAIAMENGSSSGINEKKQLNKKSEHQSIKSKKEIEEEKTVEELVDKKNNIRTITQDLDSNAKDPDDVTEADLDPQFVHIQTLTKGQVFGVADLLLGFQPSFCLVSGGAECVMLDKDLYIQYASETLQRTVRHECSPYPTDKDMQQELQSTIDWEQYKSSTFRSTLKHLGQQKTVSKHKSTIAL